MARKKTNSKKKTAGRSATRATAKAKPAAGKAKPAVKARTGGKGAPGSDVERRWNEYWSCRQKLEDAVERVKTAREALQEAQDAERSCRSEFETIKRSLTDLLDVEPAAGQARQPTQIAPRQGPGSGGPSGPQGLPASASGAQPGAKPAS